MQLNERKAIRWKEHFSTILNIVSNKSLNQIRHRPILDSLDLPPSLIEVHRAIKQTNSGKAPGRDGIPAEIYKDVGPMALDTFHNFLCSIWEEQHISQEFRDATIVSSLQKTRLGNMTVENTKAYISLSLLLALCVASTQCPTVHQS